MIGVGFDFDHTLGIDNRLEKTALVLMLGREKLLPGVDEAAAEAMIDDALRTYRGGHCTISDAMQALFLRAIGPDAPLDSLVTRFFDETIALAPKYVEALPGALDILARLESAGVPVAILTNGWNPLQQRKADLIGYHGTVIVSDDMGVRKPDGRAFRALAAALELPPRDVVYVGDAPAVDIAGALAAGMKAAWFDWEGVTYDAALPKPTWVIHELAELATHVFAHSA